MGLFDRFRKTEEPETIPRHRDVEMAVDGLDAWIQKEFGKDASRARAELRELQGNIIAGLDNVSKALDRLAEAQFSGDRRLNPKVNMIKNSFITKARSSISSVPKGEINTYRGFGDFLVSTRKAMDEAVGANRKQEFVLTTYFRAEGKAFTNAFQEAESRLGRLKESLDGDKSFWGDVEEAVLLARELRKSIKQVSFLKKSENDSRLRTKDVAASIESHKKGLDDYTKGREYASLKEAKKRLETMVQEAKELEKELTMVESLSRVFKKMAHQTGEKDVMKLADSPLETFKSMPESRLADILSSAANAASKGELDVKDSDEKRIQEFSESMASLLESKRKLEKLEKAMEGEKKSISESPAARKAKMMEDSIAAMEKELVSLKKDQESLLKEIGKSDANIKEQKKRVEELLERQGIRLRLKL